MLKIYPAVYERLQELLVEAILDSEYFSDSIWFDFEGVEYRFVATLMIRRRCEKCPDGELLLIDNITPIWWEFHSVVDRVAQINDFDFEILNQLICS